VDDGIHTSDRVDLIRDASRLNAALKVPDYNSCRPRRDFSELSSAMGRTRMQHHSVALIKKRLRRRPTETIRAASDEYDRHTCPFLKA
jgi:hypothetical protein